VKKKAPKKTKSEMSEIAQKAVQSRRQNHPEWGQKGRDKKKLQEVKV